KITLKEGLDNGLVYGISIGASRGGVDTYRDYSVQSREITSVPEFPTVAAPIAGIIGLLFVFGRKKDGL
ncbi:MAG: PEF-CTERM sorting domain-containing protein, partial [Alphaproteobacteria bacterium]